MPQLYTLNVIQMTAVFLIGSAIVYTLGALFFNVYTDNIQLEHNNDLAGVKLGFFEPLVSVAMVFSISLAWLQYNALVGEIQRETTILTVLAASARTLPEPGRSALTSRIVGYAEAVAGPEWKAMAEGQASEAVSDALRTLTRTYATTRAATPRERSILRYSAGQLVALAQSRESRVEAARFHLGSAMFSLLIIGTGISILMSWFFGLPTMLTKLVMGILFTWSMMLVVIYVYALLHPFTGPVGVSNENYLDIARSLIQSSDQ
ncbi:membrane hypothetical protein [Candidatus Terasakiella magnetica]|nr:membrane hypothetical protein [Candidatus Terasakiella magnetica]